MCRELTDFDLVDYLVESDFRKEQRDIEIVEKMKLINDIERALVLNFQYKHSEDISITRIELMDLDTDRYKMGTNIAATIDCQMFYTSDKDKEEKSMYVDVRTMPYDKDIFYGINEKTLARHTDEVGVDNYLVLVFSVGTREYSFLTPHFIKSHDTMESKYKKNRNLYIIPKSNMIWKKLRIIRRTK